MWRKLKSEYSYVCANKFQYLITDNGEVATNALASESSVSFCLHQPSGNILPDAMFYY